jgi:ArsR family metal-binding transcriptional regulator
MSMISSATKCQSRRRLVLTERPFFLYTSRSVIEKRPAAMDEHIQTRKGYSYRLVNIDCLRTSARFNVVMDLEESVLALLPYLAACLPGCNYVHGSEVVNLMEDGHIVGIYPQQITITDVEGHPEADRFCQEYFNRIREVARRQDHITPVYDKRPTLGVLDILRALPKTNCGLCGSPTCMAFAASVFRRETPLSGCPPFIDALDEHRDLLRELQAQGYKVPSATNDPARGRNSSRTHPRS